ncbi:MAG: DUF4252 domain-containing protein [Melioribacteraceae bacterium]|nr:DUF4252 domain-containing protein [Melioribacteraceae bacterium]
MKFKRLLSILLLLTVSISLTGCFGVRRSFKNMRTYVFENTNIEYEKQIEFRVGAGGLMLAGMFVKLADTDEPIDKLLGQISDVQIGIYENEKNVEFNADYKSLKNITNIMERAGWEFIVRSVNRDELTAVFVKQNNERINQLYIIAVTNEEMVLVEVHGNIDELVAIAIREKGLKFDVVSN